jgi:hypothetical protein
MVLRLTRRVVGSAIQLYLPCVNQHPRPTWVTEVEHRDILIGGSAAYDVWHLMLLGITRSQPHR